MTLSRSALLLPVVLLAVACIGEPVRVTQDGEIVAPGSGREEPDDPVAPELVPSEMFLDFGSNKSSLTVRLTNQARVSVTYQLNSMPSWLQCANSSYGSIPSRNTTIYPYKDLTFVVDRSKASFGQNQDMIVIDYKGEMDGSLIIPVQLIKEVPEEPLAPSMYVLDFGASTLSLSVRLTNNLNASVTYEISSMPSWLQCANSSYGSIPSRNTNIYPYKDLTFVVDRSKAAYGQNEGKIVISYSNIEMTGELELTAKCIRQ